jgi:hypothetical protein
MSIRDVINCQVERRKRGRPKLPSDEKGVQIYHRVLPATRDALAEIAEKTGEACGEVLDRLVAREHQRLSTVRARRQRT